MKRILLLVVTVVVLASCAGEAGGNFESFYLQEFPPATLNYIDGVWVDSVYILPFWEENNRNMTMDEFLSKFDSYTLFSELSNEEWHPSNFWLAFDTNVPLENFRLLELDHYHPPQGGNYHYEVDVLFEMEELVPGSPLIVSGKWGYIHPVRGVSFVDESGETQRFGLQLNNVGGDFPPFHLIDFERLNRPLENASSTEPETPGNLMQQIINGDLSNVTPTEREPRLLSILEGHSEWIEFDMNGDGTNELIAGDLRDEHMRIITSILAFGYEGQEVELVFHHNVELRSPFFLSRNGNFMRAMHSFGPLIAYRFSQHVFDEEWDLQWVQSLTMTVVYDLSELGYEWVERNPDMAEVGLYFSRFVADESDGERQVLDEQEFLHLFEEMTGSSFPDLADGGDVDNYRQLIERYNPSADDGANISEVDISIFPRDRGSITVTMQIPEAYNLVSIHNGNEGARLIVRDQEDNSIATLTASIPEIQDDTFARFRAGESAFPADITGDKQIGERYVVYGIYHNTRFGVSKWHYMYLVAIDGFHFSFLTSTNDPENLANMRIVEEIIASLEVIGHTE